jgi:hypothetical protein
MCEANKTEIGRHQGENVHKIYPKIKKIYEEKICGEC